MPRVASLAVALVCTGCVATTGLGQSGPPESTTWAPDPPAASAPDVDEDEGQSDPDSGTHGGLPHAKKATRTEGLNGLLQAIKPVIKRPAQEVEQLWRGVKSVRDLKEQIQSLQNKKLSRTLCPDLVDLRALSGRELFQWRDQVRGRTWVTPVVARILVDALDRFRKEHPEHQVTLGDLAQPGCGQLQHGTLIRVLQDSAESTPATQLLNQAYLLGGIPTVSQLKTVAAFPSEKARFAELNTPLLLETELLAQDRHNEYLILKTAERRYMHLSVPDKAHLDELVETVEKLVLHGQQVRIARVKSWDYQRNSQRLWLQHWIAPDRKRQLITLATQRIDKKITLAHLRRVRLAKWQDRKPTSYPNEILWQQHPDATTGLTVWNRWLAVYEAGHQTHASGRDADISYVTEGNRAHFARVIDAIDVTLSWRWFELLEEAAKDAGVTLDRILVDPRIKRHFHRRLPKSARRSHLWKRTIRLAGGHDAHHHLRVGTATPKIQAASRAYLKKRFPQSAEHLLSLDKVP